MKVGRRLIPVATLVVAIGASAAGAATAAQTGTAATKTSTATTKTGIAATKAGIATTKAGQKKVDCKVETKDGVRPSGTCEKNVKTVSLDTIAAELGVTKPALAEALAETKLWIIAAKTKPPVARFEQHLADQLHVPVAKIVAVFGSGAHLTVNGAA